MTLKDFVKTVANSDAYAYIAIRCKNGFVGFTGEVWCDNAMGFSWCTRKGFPYGEDWNKGKCEVKRLETYTMQNGKVIPCAVID